MGVGCVCKDAGQVFGSGGQACVGWKTRDDGGGGRGERPEATDARLDGFARSAGVSAIARPNFNDHLPHPPPLVSIPPHYRYVSRYICPPYPPYLLSPSLPLVVFAPPSPRNPRTT